MEILFTTTEYPTSKLIRKLTGEDVSHCAIKVGEFVIHSNFFGVIIEPYFKFVKTNKILYSVQMPTDQRTLRLALIRNYGKMYDYGAFFYIGFRLLFPKLLPKKNLWQNTGMFICTEFITDTLDQEEDSMITPYQLYLRLKYRIER